MSQADIKESALKKKCAGWIKNNPISQQMWIYYPQDASHSGIPDMLFCYAGRFGWVEFKTLKGRVQKIQEWTHAQIMKASGRGMICRSFDQFVQFINDFTKGA